MDWYTKIKTYYDTRLWDINRVKDAVRMGKITESQFTEITGDPYAA